MSFIFHILKELKTGHIDLDSYYYTNVSKLFNSGQMTVQLIGVSLCIRLLIPGSYHPQRVEWVYTTFLRMML